MGMVTLVHGTPPMKTLTAGLVELPKSLPVIVIGVPPSVEQSLLVEPTCVGQPVTDVTVGAAHRTGTHDMSDLLRAAFEHS